MKVKLPDGKIAEFPDDMAHDQIAAVIRDQYESPAREIDTRTTNVVPTTGEQFKQASSGYKQVAADAAPIAGDIAGTALMGGPGVSLLRKAGVKALPKLLPVLMRAIGSAAGSYGGSAAEQKLEGREFNNKEAMVQGAVGAGTELAGAALKPAVKPTLDFLSDFTIGGRQLKNVWRDKIIKRTTKAAEAFSGGYKPSMSKGEAGMGIGDTLKKMTDFDEVYKEYNEVVKGLDSISLDSTDEYLNGLRQTFTDKVASKSGKQLNRPQLTTKVVTSFNLDPKGRKVLRQLVEEGTLTPDETLYLLSQVNKKYGQMTPRERLFAKELKESLVKDLDYIKASSGATAAELKQNADKIFGEAHEWFKANPTAKRITQRMRTQPGSYFEAFPERSLDAIFNADPKEIAKIRYQVTKTPDGQEAWTAGVYNHVREIFEKSMKFDEATGAAQVLPAKLADTLESRLPAIKMMDADVAKNVKKEIKFYREIAPEFEKRAKKGFTQVAGPTMGYAMGGVSAIPATEAFGVTSALAVMSPKFRKILSGIAKQSTKAAGHMAVPPMMPAH